MSIPVDSMRRGASKQGDTRQRGRVVVPLSGVRRLPRWGLVTGEAGEMGRSATDAAGADPADVTGTRPSPELSEREIEVLLGWFAADSKGEAAARLFISSSTVSTHIARIRAKYAAVGRPAPTKASLLARALQDGITRLGDW